MIFSTPKYDNQPTCYSGHAKGHFRSQCPKLVTVGTPKTPQKPVALLVWPDQDQEERLLAPSGHEGKKAPNGPELDCEEEIQAGSLVSPPVVASVTPADSELDWCRPFLCGGTVEIGGSKYSVTVLRDTSAQQSVCRNVTGGKVTFSKAVLCRGLNAVEEFVTADMKLSCPLITTTAQVAVAEHLPVAGVDFLLENDSAGERVWVPTPTGGEASEESGHSVPDPVAVVTRSQTERVMQAVAPGADCDRAVLPEREDSGEEETVALEADCKEAGSPSKESSVYQLDELESDSPVSQGVGADCRSAEPPVEAPDSAEVVAEGEEGVLRIEESCAGIPHPAGHLGGSTHAVVFPGCEAVDPGTQSGPQPGMSDSLLGITTEGLCGGVGGSHPCGVYRRQGTGYFLSR